MNFLSVMVFLPGSSGMHSKAAAALTPLRPLAVGLLVWMVSGNLIEAIGCIPVQGAGAPADV